MSGCRLRQATCGTSSPTSANMILALRSPWGMPSNPACDGWATIRGLADLVCAVIPEHARAKPIELWWQDDARIGQQGTLTRL